MVKEMGGYLMRDIFFLELRECNRYIRNVVDECEKKQGYEILCSTIKKMCELASIARKEGLLDLEMAACELGEIDNNDYLKSIILLIVDGTDPELVEELGTTKYFAVDVAGFDALQYLIMLAGSLAIQAGENPRIIEERLLSLVPIDVVTEYKQKQEEAEKSAIDNKSDKEFDESFLEKYYKGDIAVSQGDEYYFQLKIIDYALRSIDDRSMQRLLREVDNMDLALALKGLSGECRRKVFSNLSVRLAIMIAEDMEFMGNVKLSDVSDASLKIFNILLHLMNTAEVNCKDAEAMVTFGKIFDITSNIKEERQIKKEEMELLRIMRDYSTASHRTIQSTWLDE